MGVNQTIGELKTDCSNVNSLPTLSFKLGGKEFSLEPDFYVLRGADSNGADECQLGITGQSVGVPGLYILGDPFLRKYYSMTVMQAGLALLWQNSHPLTAQSLSELI